MFFKKSKITDIREIIFFYFWGGEINSQEGSKPFQKNILKNRS